MPDATDPARALLRHTVATLAYRCGKAVRYAPISFPTYRAGETTRTPVEILAHIGDLLDWGLTIARGQPDWHDSKPLPWEYEIDRFYKSLKAFDDYLASPEPVHAPAEKLFQGPISDALQHTGQLTMMRRLCAAPIRGENYYRAEIVAGRIGREQTPPKKEFD